MSELQEFYDKKQKEIHNNFMRSLEWYVPESREASDDKAWDEIIRDWINRKTITILADITI